MRFQKLPDRVTLMPTCSINIQPDGIASKATIKVLQHLEEPIPVSPLRLDHPRTAEKRGYPAGNIQALMMLTGCRHSQPLSYKRPTTAKPRMQSETAFVLKNNGFLMPQCVEFFLGPWQTSSRPRPLPGDRYDWPASIDTPVDASNTGPDELSALFRTPAVNGSPRWGRPNELGSSRTSAVIPPDGVRAGLRSSGSSGQGGLSASSGSGLLPRLCLPLASSGLCSSDSGQEPRRSSRAAAPPEPAARSRSLCQSRHRAISRLMPTTVASMLYRGLRERYSYLPV